MSGRPGRAGWSPAADEIVIVATPDLACLRNAKNLIDSFKPSRQNDAPPRLVLNMVGVPKRPEIKAEDFAKTLETEPVAIDPVRAARSSARRPTTAR